MKCLSSGLFAFVFVALLAGTVPAAVPQLPTDARGLYERGCAPCHGVDGRGVDTSQLGFDVPLPDFSDCSFASREPDGDWFAVAHQGGPVRGFDRSMPSYGGAFTDEQIQLTIDRIRTFCDDDRWPRGELNLPRALFTEKAYPEDEAVWTTSADLERAGAIVSEIVYEKRFGPSSMVEVALPFGAIEPGGAAGAWNAGVGDIAVGLKHAFAHGLSSGAIASAGVEVILPTGDADRGFGTGAVRFEPYVAWGKILTSDLFLQAQAGAELSTDRTKSEHEWFWRTVLGGSWSQKRFGRTWSPMLEVLGSREMAAGARVDWGLVPQLQVSLNTRQHVLLNAGVRVPLTRADERPTQLLVYLLWDWFDGGLFAGW